MTYKMDLHMHSCLSPCGDLFSSPAAIAERAHELGLQICALTDHNCAYNTPAFEAACRRQGIFPLSGMEVTTAEEAHVLCLFASSDEALAYTEVIMPQLPPLPCLPETMGDQVYVDEDDNILGEVEVYLTGGGIQWGLDELVEETLKRGGLCIPAHVDRPAFSLTSQLGFVPPGRYSAVEITRGHSGNPNLYYGYPEIASSDAHFLDDIGKRYTKIELEELSFDGIKKALAEKKTTLRIW